MRAASSTAVSVETKPAVCLRYMVVLRTETLPLGVLSQQTFVFFDPTPQLSRRVVCVVTGVFQ
jgi:hypothetical protein